MALSFFEQRRIAERYATTLYDVAVEKNVLDTVMEELSALNSLLKECEEFALLCHSPVITTSDKKSAVEAVAQHAGLSDVTTAFLKQLADNNRLDVLSSINEQMQHIASKKAGNVTVEIISAHNLSKKQENDILASLKDALKHSIDPVWSVDDELIGGVKIRIGSRELDASVKGILARAASRLYDCIQQT